MIWIIIELGIGLAIIVFIGIIFEFLKSMLKSLIGERKTNLLLGILFVLSSVLNGFIAVDTILSTYYLYSENSFFGMLFCFIFGVISISSLYIAYILIISNEEFYNYLILIIFAAFSYLSMYMINNLNTEISAKSYKNIESIHEKIRTNSLLNEKYKNIFSEITQDKIITQREYRKLEKLERYFDYLQQQKIDAQKRIDENNIRNKKLKEAKQKILISE